MSILQRGLFEVFSIDFAGPFSPMSTDGNRFPLIFVEHLTGCPIVAAIKNETAEVVAGFLNDRVE